MSIATLLDERDIRQLAVNYALAADRRDSAMFAAQFAPDAVLEGKDFARATADEIAGIPAALLIFEKTYHTLLNSDVKLDGGRATGEIYSLAHHLTPRDDGRYDDLVMHITYHDGYSRTDRGWRIASRRVVIEFTERRIVERVDR